MKTHLYLIEVLTYGVSHPIKIGITSNVARRMHEMPAMGIYAPNLLGYFTFDRRGDAHRVETAARHRFPLCPRYGDRSREILDVEFDVALAFLLPLVGDRPFHRP